MKDYKQLLADGWVITHKATLSEVTEVHQWSNGNYSFKYSNGDIFSRISDVEVEHHHTLTPPAKRVKTWHYILHDGAVVGTTNEEAYAAFTTVTEQQPDGSWKIIETTLKASV